MLLRRFISRRLAEYYAQPSASVVGSVVPPSSASAAADLAATKSGAAAGGDPSPNPAGSEVDPLPPSLGGWQWRRMHAALYEAQDGQWLTPVELFRPHYSNALAEFVVRAAEAAGGGKGRGRGEGNDTSRGRGLHVVELGGGRGTNAALVLSHLRDVHPTLYADVRYTIYDASPTLLALQKRVVLEDHYHAEDRVEFVLQDMTDVAEGRGGDDFLPPSDVPTVVLALELLDNLAHDKVTRCRRTRELLQAEVVVDEEEDVQDDRDGTDDGKGNEERYREEFRPLTDPLLRDVLEAAPAYARGAGRRPAWVPTVACGVLRRLLRARPRAALVLADFDWLPPPELIEGRSILERRSAAADGDPIVTDMDDVDHACYLTAPRLCDILYPTDFATLGDYVARTAAAAAAAAAASSTTSPSSSANARVETMKQADFLVKYGAEQVDQTRSWTGYTPLLDDFSNCSVLTAVACDDRVTDADKENGSHRRNPIRIKR